MKRLIFLVWLFLTGNLLFAQTTNYCRDSKNLGQSPSSAFPVCGTATFQQNSVPPCYGLSIPSNICNPPGGPPDGQILTDTNAYYYKFTCFQGGTLGFIITPTLLSDDYDWQLFDITGHAANDIYTDISLFVAEDWSGTVGLTGASPAGTSLSVCGSDYINGGLTYPNPFSIMPPLIKGHTYLLMVSHFTASNQSGYSLTFSGGTASITDTTPPRLQSATVSDCGSTIVKIALNKNMQCSSLSPDGSDFALSPAGPAIVSATGDNCNSGFDMDSVTLTFASPIPLGNYLISAKNGSDGNTILDICGTPVPVGDSVSLLVPPPPPPTTMDSISPVGCAPNTLTLVFSKGILCSSIAADGSNFKVTGPTGVVVNGATCGTTSDSTVNVQLSGPIDQGGAYQIQLVTGSNGNTLIDECQQPLTPGTLNFIVADTVYAQIQYAVDLNCGHDTINYSNPGGDGINVWKWTFDDSVNRSGEQQQVAYTIFGSKTAQLVVSNGVCADSSSVTISLDNTLKAIFEATNLLCPRDEASFTDSSIGSIVSYNWDFGDGTGSTQQTPPPKAYAQIQSNEEFVVRLTVTNTSGCTDTASQVIQDIANCYIAVPSAFTPNGDGINDYLYPLNAYKAENLEFRVYNRYGNLVFQTQDWTIRWDGTVNGTRQPVGTYVWTLRYTNIETGQKVSQKGTSVLIR